MQPWLFLGKCTNALNEAKCLVSPLVNCLSFVVFVYCPFLSTVTGWAPGEEEEEDRESKEEDAVQPQIC